MFLFSSYIEATITVVLTQQLAILLVDAPETLHRIEAQRV